MTADRVVLARRFDCAFQRFRAANLVNMPILAFYYIGPLVVLRFVDSLVVVMIVLVLCRLVMTWCYWRICIEEMPTLAVARADWRHARELAGLGGWMTVSNLAWPVLMYVDRFLVASIVSAAAAGYYTTPSDLLGRFSLVTIAVMGTAFPALAASYKTDPGKAATLVRRSMLAIVSVLFLPSLLITAFSHEILALWIGPAFAGPAGPVMQWLALAVVLAAADAVVGGFIDSIGRPDVNAKFSLVELALYVPILVGLLHLFGIEGAAIAWTARVAFDLCARVVIATWLAPALRLVLTRALVMVGIATALIALPLVGGPVAERIAIVCVAAGVYAFALWVWGVTREERDVCAARLKLRAVPVTLS